MLINFRHPCEQDFVGRYRGRPATARWCHLASRIIYIGFTIIIWLILLLVAQNSV